MSKAIELPIDPHELEEKIKEKVKTKIFNNQNKILGQLNSLN
jgi:hypothetical protein